MKAEVRNIKTHTEIYHRTGIPLDTLAICVASPNAEDIGVVIIRVRIDGEVYSLFPGTERSINYKATYRILTKDEEVVLRND